MFTQKLMFFLLYLGLNFSVNAQNRMVSSMDSVPSNAQEIEKYEWNRNDLKVELLFDSRNVTIVELFISDPHLKHRDLTIRYDDKQQVRSILCKNHDGSVRDIHIEDGSIYSKEETSLDGSVVLVMYYPSGKIKSEQHQDRQGVGYVKTYDESGDLVDIRFI